MSWSMDQQQRRRYPPTAALLLTVENISDSVRMMIQGGLFLAPLIASAVSED